MHIIERKPVQVSDRGILPWEI